MAEITDLLKEADKLGILNIDVSGEQLSPEVIQTAIDATKNLNAKLDKTAVAKKLQNTKDKNRA